MIWYNQSPCNVFVCSLISGKASKRVNKYAEAFTTDFGWEQAYPMKKESDMHEPLLLIFQRMGVPDNMIVDGSEEQVLGNFQKCRIQQTQLHSPWQNAADGSIR